MTCHIKEDKATLSLLALSLRTLSLSRYTYTGIQDTDSVVCTLTFAELIIDGCGHETWLAIKWLGMLDRII